MDLGRAAGGRCDQRAPRRRRPGRRGDAAHRDRADAAPPRPSELTHPGPGSRTPRRPMRRRSWLAAAARIARAARRLGTAPPLERAGPGAGQGLDATGRLAHPIALPAYPTRGLALAAGKLRVGLEDLALRRIDVPQTGLARSSWPKARGDGGTRASL